MGEMMLTYVSMFSGAGIGCHGLGMAGFQCLATAEISPRRLEIQKFNNKCRSHESYICGDLADAHILQSFFNVTKKNNSCPDVVIATPPCQGMSVFNHKKQNEIQRNSLIVSAIQAVRELNPKVFIFENVSQFFKTLCDLPNGCRMPIGDAIDETLGENYHIFRRVINLKNFGCPSSRTRALSIGVDKNLSFSPLSIFPDWEPEKTLYETIGDMLSLSTMGEIQPNDLYHSFKPYAPHMRPWISNLHEGQSAFGQKSPNRRPHRIINGKRIENKNGNGDKYRRQRWDNVPPCIHTRNDILSSQNTIHPCDDRVFSIREIMRMLGISDDFQWVENSLIEIIKQPLSEQQEILRNHENNIRQCLGEAVSPVVIFKIAEKIRQCLANESVYKKRNMKSEVSNISIPFSTNDKKNICDVGTLMRLVEDTNNKKSEHAAYYTPPTTAFNLLQMFPNMQGKRSIRILEPSVGAGQILRFLPSMLSNYEHVEIDAMDIDESILNIAKKLSAHYTVPRNVKINFIHGDFLDYDFRDVKYDVIIGNPPFRKMPSTESHHYKKNMRMNNILSRNSFAFFMMKALECARHVVFICPKSFLNTPEYNEIRNHINSHHAIRQICDFGEQGFREIKIETLAIAIQTNCKQNMHEQVLIESVFQNTRFHPYAMDIFSKDLPYWVIYRNEQFNTVLNRMSPGVFTSFRDRQITKKHTRSSGGLRVIKSRNVQSNKVCNTDKDVYVDLSQNFAVRRFMNRKNVALIPNLSYAPRACRLPKNSVADGSVAILCPKDDSMIIQDEDLKFFSSDDFRAFYRVARNYGTRTLNIDSNSVFFFGVRT